MSQQEAVTDDVASLSPLIRRVVAGRVADEHVIDDIVQETLARVIAARPRPDDEALAPYAIVVARNLVHALWARRDVGRRHEHQVFDLVPVADDPETHVLELEEATALTNALGRLDERDREILLAHEVEGRGTSSLADERATTSAAIATQLNRARARLRVEYVLESHGGDLPTPKCRPVLLAISSRDSRRQRELDASHHLLECEVCAKLSRELVERRRRDTSDDARIVISSDEDVVKARRIGRQLASEIGFGATEATVIATAISEIARNIVQFATRGEIVMRRAESDDRQGMTVTARDAGPGIADITSAQQDGFSSYGGMGLGLPGSRRLMDEFDITSEANKGTVVVMTKWRRS